MIQRVQSIYLAIAFIAATALFFVPVISFVDMDNQGQGSIKELVEIKTSGKYVMSMAGPNQVETYIPGIILTIAVAALALITIFLYKNRKRQISLCWINAFLALGLSIFMMTKAQPASLGQVSEWTAKIGSYLFTVIIIALMLALRSIRRDENLVRSADRLR
ncbi:DUF4293 domain-containing protein [Solitalea sp. MAHUQ-68]|uniref:DUF4293 domain-containing protein n=1 Tax=Solitalea agri TaxID=2953739 RepID=A0A9X2EZC2_9SPHI|nr:DUF4293 domain-containing protein [Solitalea agri]MCO4291827.1 DUF4293 domain-containing protein [Solitalea agri]